MTVKENVEKINSLSSRLESVEEWVNDNSTLFLGLEKRVPSHADLKLIVDRIDDITNTLEKLIQSNNFVNAQLVQFKRDCGQDILSLKRKVNYMDSIQSRDDRSRY